MAGRLDLNAQGKLHGKCCSVCGKRVPRSSHRDMCHDCIKRVLYADVKEYVRTHEVTELEVADKFDIDIAIVKEWIREGMLEHKQPRLNPEEF